MPYISSFIKRIKRVMAAICILAAAACLSACGPNLDIGSTPGAPSVSAAVTQAAPQKGGELSVPMINSPKTAHPLYLHETSMINLYWLIFEPLIAMDENNLPANCLADSWEYDAERNVYIIRIRSGVKWHGDRGELTARDAVFTLNKILSDPQSIYYSQTAKYVDSVELEDVSTIIIRPKLPGYALLYSLNVPVIPQAYYEQLESSTLVVPVGSGPYTALSADFGEAAGMLLNANEKWWKKQPYIQTVRAKGYEDNAQAVAAFERGELDCVYTDQLTSGIYSMKDNVESVEYASYYYDFLAPNLDREIFSQKAVRQAISYAIDRKSIVSNIYLNHAVLSETPFMPGTALNDTAAKRYDYNLNMAKSILEQAGWTVNQEGIRVKEGKELAFELITLEDTDNPVKKDTAAAISKQLALIGIKVTVAALEPETLEDRISKRDFDMLLTGAYLSGAPDMEFIYSGKGNISGYSDQALENMLKELNDITDREEFFAALYALHNAMAEELPHIGLFFHTHTLLYKTGVYPSVIYRDMRVFSGIDKWFIA